MFNKILVAMQAAVRRDISAAVYLSKKASNFLDWVG